MTPVVRVALLLMLLLLGCGHSNPGSLEGAWQSNRDLTLLEFREARSWTPEQWTKLSSPDFFGQMLYVFHGNHVIVVFDGECSPPSSFVIDSTSSQIRLPSSGPDKSDITLTLEGDRLFVPVSLLRGSFRETFTPTELDQATRRHPCVAEFLETS
jgi:hypothetical protein